MKHIPPLFVTVNLMLSLIILSCAAAPRPQPVTIADFAEKLAMKGLNIGKRTEVFFEMVSATDGCRIDVNGDEIEVYQYDPTLKSGTEIQKKLATEGLMGQRMFTRNNLLLVSDPKHKDWPVILEVFQSL